MVDDNAGVDEAGGIDTRPLLFRSSGSYNYRGHFCRLYLACAGMVPGFTKVHLAEAEKLIIGEKQ